MASTHDFAVNIVMVINITISKTFNIHLTFNDLVKHYSCYNVFNQKDMDTFNVLTFIQVRTDKNKFMETRNINTFNVLTFMQVRTDKNKFMQIKNRQVRI